MTSQGYLNVIWEKQIHNSQKDHPMQDYYSNTNTRVSDLPEGQSDNLDKL